MEKKEYLIISRDKGEETGRLESDDYSMIQILQGFIALKDTCELEVFKGTTKLIELKINKRL